MAKCIATLALAAVAAGAAPAAERGETVSGLQDQTQVAVTIYNDNLALIRDTRRIDLPAGESALAWRDVSALMRPETALLREASAGTGLRLIEQNFDFDLLTPQKLLEKYVGRSIQVIHTNPATGAERVESGTLLSANQGAVVQFPDRIESHPDGRIAFAAVPDNLRDRPTLVLRLAPVQPGARELELSYLSAGLSWRADYVAELSGADDRLDLNGWVTLNNQSGSSYRNARLQLVAGAVNLVQPEPQRMQVQRSMALAQAAAPPMQQEDLFEYHLYTLQRPTTIADNQTKQVALLTAAGVPARKQYELRGGDAYYVNRADDLGQKLKVGVFVEFDNKGQDLGVPLPRGIVRVYKKDAAGNAQFVGEDRIDHTPKNETVRLKLGEAFDVTAIRKQTDFRRRNPGPDQKKEAREVEGAFEIRLKNAKSEPIRVKVVEPIPGDWEMISESLPHEKATSGTAVWMVPVAAESETVLSYRVRVRF